MSRKKLLKCFQYSPSNLKKVHKCTQLVQTFSSGHLFFFAKFSKKCHVLAHKACWYARKYFLKKYSKTWKLEYFDDMGSQKAAKNHFFAKHQGKWRNFCKQIWQEGLICLATFMGLIGKEFYGEKTKLLYIKEKRKLGYYHTYELKWFRNYLNSSNQFVSVNNENSL